MYKKTMLLMFFYLYVKIKEEEGNFIKEVKHNAAKDYKAGYNGNEG